MGKSIDFLKKTDEILLKMVCYSICIKKFALNMVYDLFYASWHGTHKVLATFFDFLIMVPNGNK